jgi:hypothetical protein
MILTRFRCGTTPAPRSTRDPSRFGSGHRNVALTPDDGMLIIDVVGEVFACIEALYRDEMATFKFAPAEKT